MRRTQTQKPVLGLESLEHRVVPATVSIIREATGANAAAIQATVDTFRADLGTNNGGGPAQTSGRREISWDGVPDTASTPALMPATQFQGRGATFTSPGTGVIVSQDDDTGADADPDLVRFSDINPTYATAFATFSAQRLFSAAGSNVVDVVFTVPGSTTPAVTRGFGAVFTDVDAVGATRVDFFDEHGTQVFSRQVLGTPGDSSFSFLGVAFAGNCIARVWITSGGAALAALTNDVTQGGTTDLAVMDDFIYGEPVHPALQPLAVSGQTNASAGLFTPDRTTGQYPATPTATLSPFGSVATNVRSVVADVDGDCIPDTIMVTGPGTPIRVAVVSGADNTTVLVAPFDPFGGNFTGGGFVTAADFTGDGNAEFVVTPDQGGGPRISIFSRDPVSGALTTRANFITIEANFRGGCRPGAGDINNDGVPDLAVSAGFLGGPRIVLLDGTKLFTTDGINPADKLVNDFFAYSELLRNGAYVAVGDVNGDGFGDLIFGAGPGGGPEIRIASGQTLLTSGSAAALSNPIADYFLAGDLSNRGGVRVAAKDADGDDRADVAAGTGGGQASFARVYLGKDFTSVAEPTTFQDLNPFAGVVLADGVYVG